jgi:hypothetical protein
MKLGLCGAAVVILASALASPVMAQQVITDPGYCAQFYPNANCQNSLHRRLPATERLGQRVQ